MTKPLWVFRRRVDPTNSRSERGDRCDPAAVEDLTAGLPDTDAQNPNGEPSWSWWVTAKAARKAARMLL
jgi:hypothetical protein